MDIPDFKCKLIVLSFQSELPSIAKFSDLSDGVMISIFDNGVSDRKRSGELFTLLLVGGVIICDYSAANARYM
jgi:hypothetical protein